MGELEKAFGLDQGAQYKMTFFEEGRPLLAKEEQLWVVSPDNPKCPLSQFIGNKKAVRCLSRAAFVAWGRYDHCCSDQSFALLGPSSTGKTTLARLFANTIILPFVEIHPQSVRSTGDIFELVRDTLCNMPFPTQDGGEEGITMAMIPDMTILGPSEPPFYVWTPPPIVIFVDEVHTLKNTVVHALLKATEPKDAVMPINLQNVMNCANVLWIIATTERGLLFDAFDNRFRKVLLELYNREEIAQIIQLHNPDWNEAACKLAAHYSYRVPREAIAFAADMKAEEEMTGGSWEQVAARVANTRRIDRFGMTNKRLTILAALGQQGPISRANLCNFVDCKPEELTVFQMPALLASARNEPALVVVTNRGYAITQAGLRELEKRGIPHQGEQVMAAKVERIDFGEWDPDDFGDEELFLEFPHTNGMTPVLANVPVTDDSDSLASSSDDSDLLGDVVAHLKGLDQMAATLGKVVAGLEREEQQLGSQEQSLEEDILTPHFPSGEEFLRMVQEREEPPPPRRVLTPEEAQAEAPELFEALLSHGLTPPQVADFISGPDQRKIWEETKGKRQ